jgi:hypothetical protein
MSNIAANISVGVCAIIGLVIVLGLLIALPIMWLWNCLCPELFGLPTISFWQALGLYFLLACLFPRNWTK